MDPHDLRSMVDPFGGLGHGVPGDPMEQVLSLQTFESAEVQGERTCGCNTIDCTTYGCTFSCPPPPPPPTSGVECYPTSDIDCWTTSGPECWA